MMSITVHQASLPEIDSRVLYALLKLRVDVFVVEQQCAYAELDGRDVEAGAVHLWAERDGEVVATLRVLDDGEQARIGRVATALTARSAGLAAQLMREALRLCGPRPVVLDAQSQLEGWYSRFGFERTGPEFIEDGIPHVPMRRPG
ncbi:MAG: GNAT family N-acetyltransferase [Actinobacteria bacterium]|nr:GNAT family N-acetyltransferase [Actinomycetota bacterium]